MADNIPPEDIISEILLSLPVKSLLRFRSVSKSWLRLISNPNFIFEYRKKASINPQSYIISRQGFITNNVTEIKLNGDDFSVNELRFPCEERTKVVGVCDGIVCLASNFGNCVIMWNPATRKYTEAYRPDGEGDVDLPHMEGVEGMVCIGRSCCGFGLDVDGSGYIYLSIYCRRWDLRLDSFVRMYSSRSRAWKVLEGDFRFQNTEWKNCAVVRGVPYWTAFVRKVEDDDKLTEVLISFDVRHEVFKMVEYPEVAFKRGNRAYFVEFNDRLASLTFCPGEQCNQLVDVWVLDDEEHWSKKFTVGPILIEIERLVGCTRNGDILGLDTKRGLFLFLSRNKEIHYIHTDDGYCGEIDVHNYYETLASNNGMKNIEDVD